MLHVMHAVQRSLGNRLVQSDAACRNLIICITVIRHEVVTDSNIAQPQMWNAWCIHTDLPPFQFEKHCMVHVVAV